MAAAQTPGPVAIDDGRYTAPACFAESLRIFTETGMEGERARTLREWGRFEIKMGDRDKGRAMWQEVRETFARLGMLLEVERMGNAHGADR
jgi:hypothetical protein